MRIAAVADVHGRTFLEAFREAMGDAGEPDLFLLGGDLTDRNRIEEFVEVAAEVRDRVSCPVACVFGNNEWAEDHGEYRRRFDFDFLDDEDRTFPGGDGTLRVIGSTGALDEPTWWQRRNVPGAAAAYAERVRRLDGLLAGDDPRLLLTHYPPTFATMGGEKEAWRPQLGSRGLEAVVIRRRPDAVVHGHVHKGIPYAELRAGRGLDAFAPGPAPIPVYNVAFPVTKRVTVFDLPSP